MTKTLSDPETECLKLKKAINENHQLAQKAAGDAIERAILAGELLGKWKELLPHGKYESFIETHFDGSLRTARAYMQAAKGLSELPKRQRTAVLSTEDSLAGLLGRLKSDEHSVGREARTSEGTPGTPKGGSNPTTNSVSAKGKPSDNPASSGPASGEAAVQDYGRCPNCASTKWTESKDGVSCAKCGHAHGEPTGGTDEDRIDTQRLKTVKTVEALLRAFDDLNWLLAKPDQHTEAVASCKFLLKTARAWK